MRGGIRIVAGIGIVAALGMIGVSAAMNYRFGASFGQTEFDAHLYGGASALGDVLKGAGPFLIAYAWSSKRWAQAFAASLVWLVCALFSFTSTVGFGITNRTFAKDATILQAELNKSQLEALKDSQKQLSFVRAKVRLNGHSRSYRKSLERQVARLEQQVADQQTRLAFAPKVLTRTTQSDALSKVLQVHPSLVMNGLVMLLAILLELGSGLGLYESLGALGMAVDPSPGEASPNCRSLRPRREKKGYFKGDNVGPLARPQASNDALTSFLNLRVSRVEGSAVEATTLYQSFVSFCRDEGLPEPTQKSFGQEISARGYAKDRRGRGGRVRSLSVELIIDSRLAAVPKYSAS